jgi:hypothetical protein
MSRSVSQAARRAMYDQSTEEVFVILLEISNESDPSDPIRTALDSQNIDSKITVDSVDTHAVAVTFAGGFFAIDLPEETGEGTSSVRLTVDNVDRAIVTAIRNATEPPDVRMWVVLKSAPNVVEAGPYYFVLESADYDMQSVSGELSFEDITGRRYPKHEFTPHLTPGLF